jgi:hypothetical protein
MPLQLLHLKLDDITAGDYLAWCRDPEPPALGFGLRSIQVEADPLGDTITAVLDWRQPAPSPSAAAAAAAGLPLLPGTRIHPLTTWAAAAIGRLSAEEGVGVIDPERRPLTRVGDDQSRGHLGWAEALAARGDPAGAREHAAPRARALPPARLRALRGGGRE